MPQSTLSSRALRLAAIRIGLVATLAGLVSYQFNSRQIRSHVGNELQLATRERLNKEAERFRTLFLLQRSYIEELR